MLKISNLHAGYGKIEVLHGINLEVPKGRVVTLIGSNGAGKTTTMRAISGMIASTSEVVLKALALIQSQGALTMATLSPPERGESGQGTPG